MGMSSIRSMNWTMGTLEMIRQDQINAQFEREQVKKDSQFICDHMTQEDWRSWWENSPDNNNEYRLALAQKVAEIKLQLVDRGNVSYSQSTAAS